MARTRRDEWALWIGVGVAFAPALAGLARQWLADDTYAHGFLVPLVSVAAARAKLPELGPSRRWPVGLGGVGAALALYAAGLAAGGVALQGLALVLALCGLVAFRWGLAGLRRLAFPLVFLLFMIPLPAAWLAPVVVGLQLGVSSAAVAVLHEFGVAVLREGNVIVIPGGSELFVGEACSGITSVVTLIPLGVLLAYFTERSTWRRVAIVAAVVPAALVGNFIRVVATVLAARAIGAERATSGWLHEYAGIMTFAFACLLVVGLGALLREPATPASAAESASP